MPVDTYNQQQEKNAFHMIVVMLEGLLNLTGYFKSIKSKKINYIKRENSPIILGCFLVPYICP